MTTFYRLAADAVVVIHFAYAASVVLGLALILIGIPLRWRWIRNRWFRLVHLAMIGIVVAEAWAGIVCPLTVWEKNLRELAGDKTYQGDFIANWVHDALFFDFPPWVFTVIYTAVGLLIASTFWLAPPDWKKPLDESP